MSETRQAPKRKASAAILHSTRGLPLDERIEARRRLAADRDSYTVLGRIKAIEFDPRGMSLPEPRDIQSPVSLNLLQWQSCDVARLGEHRNCRRHPLLAIDKKEEQFLLLGEVPHPHDLPDLGRWVPTDLPGWKWTGASGKAEGGLRPASIPQFYADRTTLMWGRFLVIQPVHKILLDTFQFAAARSWNGSQMAFLIDPHQKEGHLVGGDMLIDLRIHAA
jgi:hypothetical protein